MLLNARCPPRYMPIPDGIPGTVKCRRQPRAVGCPPPYQIGTVSDIRDKRRCRAYSGYRHDIRRQFAFPH
jgi:hypothetical protein